MILKCTYQKINKDKHGNDITEIGEILKRWKEYISELYEGAYNPQQAKAKRDERRFQPKKLPA